MSAEGAPGEERGEAPPQELLEHAVRSQALTRIAAGMAHDVKNPLNALALQLAILSDKLADAGTEVSQASAHHLSSMRDQIARVNEVIRRFVDVTDPAPALGWTDLGALVSDASSLYGHDARRRRVELTTELPSSTARCPADAGRLSRIVLALLWRALAETPGGGRMAVRVVNQGAQVLVEVEHTPGPDAPDAALIGEVVSRGALELGGRLDSGPADGKRSYTLRLPRERNGDGK
jgi:signal transduction histidine kinase